MSPGWHGYFNSIFLFGGSLRNFRDYLLSISTHGFLWEFQQKNIFRICLAEAFLDLTWFMLYGILPRVFTIKDRYGS